nr:TIGR02391 family protein [uncultured Pseudogulbenkiania sp.]
MIEQFLGIRLPGTDDVTSIQYLGMAGISSSCFDAIKRLVQYGDDIHQAIILTARQRHAFLLTVNCDELMVVKGGFSSGYRGEGPSTLADALLLLRTHGVELDEVEVPVGLLDRLDASALSKKDMALICTASPVRPQRFHDYIYDIKSLECSGVAVWQRLHPTIPWALLDPRLSDLALRFFTSPSDVLLQGFRRLEDIFRARLETKESGYKLFSQAFHGDDSHLTWPGIEKSEQVGRCNLFTGAFMAFRNPRAHREIEDNIKMLLSEFLLLNQLYALESKAVERDGGFQ